MKRLTWLAGVAILAACSSGADMNASVISTLNTVGTGSQRVLVEVLDRDGSTVRLDSGPVATLRDENGSPVMTATGEEVWLVPNEAVAYAFWVDIPAPETYQLTIEAGDQDLPPAGFVAVADPQQIGPGESAPPIAGSSVTGPAAVVFASADWCPSDSCQPLIDQVETAATDAGIDFIQSEVFANPEAGSESDLELSEDVANWGIPSQPWLFVVDTSGSVTAVFEGGVSARELSDAIAGVS